MPIEIYNGLAPPYRHLIEHSTLRFSGGEIHVRLKTPITWLDRTFQIVAHIVSADDIMETVMATDALRRELGSDIKVHLCAPYFPYARQDRVCYPGEALSARVMCDMINAQNYESVTVWDAHSSVVPACLDRVTNIHCSEFVKTFATKHIIFLAPDKGAENKVSECARVVGAEYLVAGKKRDAATGAITGSHIEWPVTKQATMDADEQSPFAHRDFLIIDDICDGGRTFVELAKVLRPRTTGKIFLYVTHGIFSKGMQIFDGLIDHIYCANPWPGTLAITKVERSV